MGNFFDDNYVDDIATVYNTNYLNNNLYKVYIYDSDNTYTVETTNFLQVNAINVSFDTPSLSLERNKVTKKFQVSSTEPYKYPNTLSITYRENDLWSVYKFHNDWISLIFNKDKDAFNSKSSDNQLSPLFKRFEIIFPIYSGSKKLKKLILKNVLPQNVANGLNFSWGSSGGIIQHKINYYVEDWEFKEE